MKKLLCTLLAICMLAGCTPKQDNTVSTDSLFKAGTYTGVSSEGRNGEVKVEVEFSDTEIISVVVSEHEETPGISDPAIEKVPGMIVDAQTTKVDSISGCTITSDAIKAAVNDAITQAGADPETLEAKEKEASTEVVEMEANIVVVGGGAAGLATAVSAAYEGLEDIVLLEKVGSLGGNAIRSGGFIEDLNPGDDRAIEMNDSYKKTLDEMFAAGPLDEDEATVWEDLTAAYDEYVASGSTKLFDTPALLAVEYHRVEGSPCIVNMPYGDVVNTFDDWFINEVGAEMSSMVGIVGYTWPRWTYPVGYERGVGYFEYLTKYMNDKNYPITVMTDTPATELLTDENNDVVGVKAVAVDGTTYMIKANAVVLATGGFSANGEMLMEYDTQWGITNPNVKTDNCPGDTGDGILMAQELDAMVAGMDNIMMFPLSTKGDSDADGAFGFNGSSNLMINTEGKRFVDETASRFEICHAIFEQAEPYYYIISDSLNGRRGLSAEDLAKSKAAGVVYEGETIADLAKAIGVDEATLEATVEQYNNACATGNDELFGRTSYADGSEIVAGPFYATALEPCSHITIGGLVTNDDSVVIRNDGTPINNLYAVGETVVGYCGLSAFAWGKLLGTQLAQ